MYGKKHGRHLEQVLSHGGEPTDLWMLVNYGDPNFVTLPFMELTLGRVDWLQLGTQIDMMSLTRPVQESKED